MFIEILFEMLLFKGGVLIYAEHCIYTVDIEPIVDIWPYTELGLRGRGDRFGGWDERMDETHLSIFHSVSNRAHLLSGFVSSFFFIQKLN